jgi:serine/threonine protein kinase
VAIKVIQASSSRELEALHRFLREAASAAAVNHPAVVRALHVDVSRDGLLFQVQELVLGETLSARLHARPWAAPIVARVFTVLCEGLAAAHARGIVHRDVKPSNVMITHVAPGLKLLDFGIAKLYEGVLNTGVGTRSGTVLGTPAFMAPEQFDGSHEVTDRADVYSVGVMLFILLSGRHPFESDSARKIFMSHLFDAPPNLASIVPDVPASLAAIVPECLRKEAKERPAAADLALRFKAIADAAGAPALDELERQGHVQDAAAAHLPTTKVERRRASSES